MIIMLKSTALQMIADKVYQCNRCQEISEYRMSMQGKHVPGNGNANAKFFWIAEAPGKTEAEEGIPLCGKSGKLFNNILLSLGLEREDVFVTNILRCRPPGNRDPQPEESKNCRKFLELQLKTVDPEWIICLGRIAVTYLLGLEVTTPISCLRGKIHSWNGKKVIATYHPAYVLRNQSAKIEVWKDLQPLLA